MGNQHHPYHPIIYVRGFAMLQSEIEDTCADPYMGFNIGSTKSRMVWGGQLKKFFFESPIVRLQREGPGYRDAYVDGDDIVVATASEYSVPYQCIVIFRYYDEASEAFGTADTPPIEHFADELSNLILSLRKRICENPDNGVADKDFRVYLVAHSMGGLVCRAFLQNPALGCDEARACVDKLFTYATPHNGIDLRIVRNVPAWASFGDVNNFNQRRMAEYFALPNSDDVAVVKNFPPEKIFNLVGTNPADYTVLGGLSSWGAGNASDGLVRIENATTHGLDSNGHEISSPRAFVHRCHSGHYGIVNSEEGFQNLTRFLFGKLRVDGILDIDELSLPPGVQKALDDGKDIKASYQFEVVASVRGCQWQMHRRTVQENSAIFRRYDELFPKKNGARAPDRSESPHLFSVFLDPTKSLKKGRKEVGPVSFALDLRVRVPDYQIDKVLFLKEHYEGGYIYRRLIIIEVFADSAELGGWTVKYGFQDQTANTARKNATMYPLGDRPGHAFDIEIATKARPGITGKLRLEVTNWNNW